MKVWCLPHHRLSLDAIPLIGQVWSLSVCARLSLPSLFMWAKEVWESRSSLLTLNIRMCMLYVRVFTYAHSHMCTYTVKTQKQYTCMHPQKADSLLKVICGRTYYVTSRVFATGSSTLDDMSEQLAAILNKLEEGRTFFFLFHFFFACFISFLHKHKT